MGVSGFTRAIAVTAQALQRQDTDGLPLLGTGVDTSNKPLLGRSDRVRLPLLADGPPTTGRKLIGPGDSSETPLINPKNTRGKRLL